MEAGIKFEIFNNSAGSTGDIGRKEKPDNSRIKACAGSEENSGNGDTIRPGNLPANTHVDMVEISAGCGGDCLQCGAFEENSMKTRAISVDQLESNLTQEIVDVATGVRIKIIDLFRTFVTTGVDSEPLETDIFVLAAEKINQLSNGKSRMVCISHGLRAIEQLNPGGEDSNSSNWIVDPKQTERLSRINQLMLQDVVPLFVLSLDPARSKGLAGRNSKKYWNELKSIEESDGYKKFLELVKYIGTRQQVKEGLTTIDQRLAEPPERWKVRMKKNKEDVFASIRCKITKGEALTEEEKAGKDYLLKRDQLRVSGIEANARSYAATLSVLIPAIKAGKRVTVSLQGDDDSDSLVYVGLTSKIWQRTTEILINEYGVPRSILEEEKLNVQPTRLYINAGRAVAWLGGLDSNRHCAVIPDAEFVAGPFRKDPYKTNRGRLRANGDLEIQLYRGSRTYNDTVDPLGGPAPNPWKKVDLSQNPREGQYNEVIEQPRDFVGRMKYYANPRIIVISEDLNAEEQEDQDLRTIYPFTQIQKEDNGKYWKLVEMIAKYLNVDFKASNFTEEELENIQIIMDDSEALSLVMRSLIPEEYLKANTKKEEDPESCAIRVMEEIICVNTPTLSIDKGTPMTSEESARARKMGKILAVKSLLRDVLDLTIKVKAAEQDPVEATIKAVSAAVQSEQSTSDSSKEVAVEGETPHTIKKAMVILHRKEEPLKRRKRVKK